MTFIESLINGPDPNDLSDLALKDNHYDPIAIKDSNDFRKHCISVTTDCASDKTYLWRIPPVVTHVEVFNNRAVKVEFSDGTF